MLRRFRELAAGADCLEQAAHSITNELISQLDSTEKSLRNKSYIEAEKAVQGMSRFLFTESESSFDSREYSKLNGDYIFIAITAPFIPKSKRHWADMDWYNGGLARYLSMSSHADEIMKIAERSIESMPGSSCMGSWEYYPGRPDSSTYTFYKTKHGIYKISNVYDGGGRIRTIGKQIR